MFNNNRGEGMESAKANLKSSAEQSGEFGFGFQLDFPSDIRRFCTLDAELKAMRAVLTEEPLIDLVDKAIRHVGAPTEGTHFQFKVFLSEDYRDRAQFCNELRSAMHRFEPQHQGTLGRVIGELS